MRFGKRIIMLTVCLATFLLSAVAYADTVIGGVAAEGNLRITVLNGGRIGLERYINNTWQRQVYAVSNKGSHLFINGTGYPLGYFGGDAVSPVSNVLVGSGNNHIRASWNAGGMLVTLNLIYNSGDAYYSLQWTLQNNSGSTLSDIRFFHGQDTYFYGGDNGAGYWDATNRAIGVQKLVGGQLMRMSLQAITAPYAYESRNYGSVAGSVTSGALLSATDPVTAIDPNEGTDNGYALEWRNASMANGAVWTITAYEKLADVNVGNVAVTAPTLTGCLTGMSCDLSFTVDNLTDADVPVALSTEVDLANWTAVIQSPANSNITIPGSGSQQVFVRVTVPDNTPVDTVANVTLHADDGSEVIPSDTGSVRVKNTYTYTVNVTGTGTVTSSPANLSCQGASCTGEFPPNTKVVLSFKPPRGQRVLNVRVNGVNLGPVKAVTLKNLKKQPLIEVTFG